MVFYTIHCFLEVLGFFLTADIDCQPDKYD